MHSVLWESGGDHQGRPTDGKSKPVTLFRNSHGRGNGWWDWQERVQVHALVVSYEMAMAEITELRRLEWGVMVVDEGHRLKNPNSRLFRARARQHLC